MKHAEDGPQDDPQLGQSPQLAGSYEPSIRVKFQILGFFLGPVVVFVIAAYIWPHALKTVEFVFIGVPACLLFAYICLGCIRAVIESARMVRVLGHMHCPGCGLQFGIKEAKKARDYDDELWEITCRQCNSRRYFDVTEEELIDPALVDQQQMD